MVSYNLLRCSVVSRVFFRPIGTAQDSSNRMPTCSTFPHYAYYPPLCSNFLYFPFRNLPYALSNSAFTYRHQVVLNVSMAEYYYYSHHYSSRVLMLCRIRNSLVAIPAADYPVPETSSYLHWRIWNEVNADAVQHKHLQSILLSRNQSVELSAHRCGCLDTRKYSFTARIVNIWNSLPNFVVDVDIVSLFKAHLDKFWMHQDVLYDFTADLTGIGDRSVRESSWL